MTQALYAHMNKKNSFVEYRIVGLLFFLSVLYFLASIVSGEASHQNEMLNAIVLLYLVNCFSLVAFKNFSFDSLIVFLEFLEFILVRVC
jgi:hypothetical protein